MIWRSRGTQVLELLDRTMQVADFWDGLVLGHDLARQDEELYAAAVKIGEALGDFYQLAGQRMPDREERPGAGSAPASLDGFWRAKTFDGPAPDSLAVRFTLPDAGWIGLEVDGLTYDRPVRCSCVYDPFPDFVSWLEAICRGDSHAAWRFDSEGYTTALIFNTKTGGSEEYASLILCEAGERIYTLTAMPVLRRVVVSAFWQALRAMVTDPAYCPREWEMPEQEPAITFDIDDERWTSEVDRRVNAVETAHPYGATILRFLESETVEEYLAG